MIVFGADCFVISKSGKEAIVNAFSDQVGTLTVQIVDAAIAYDCPITNQTFILVARNVLHVPSMDHNMIPPFIMREAGLTVNDTPKIHIKEPTLLDHAIICDEFDLHIRLHLHGIFSCFKTRTRHQRRSLTPILL